ncbi:shikimate dehydrogenase family protein [Nanoarchaeota archaeon]
MITDKETKICLSIAEKPGNFGAKFHNKGYKILGLNQVYIPRKIESSQLKTVLEAVRVLNIRGCSVSMPHKIEVIKYLDSVDEFAEKIGAINTIVRQDDGSLKGYNTDFYGAKRAIEDSVSIKDKDILLIGAGGVAKAIGFAVKELQGKLTITNKTIEKAEKLAKKLDAEVLSWDELKNSSGFMLINATSVGMNNSDESIVDKSVIASFKVIMDVVIYPSETKLLRDSKELGNNTIPGTLMCVYQAAEQFKLYSDHEAPKELIEETLKDMT